MSVGIKKPITTNDDPKDLGDELIERLYGKHFESLVRFIRTKYGEGPPHPEDVAQQAFLKLTERRKLSDINNLPAFLWRSAQNYVSSEKRAQATQVRRAPDVESQFFSEKSSQNPPDHVFYAKTQIKKINLKLGKMPATRRRAFLLNRVEGMSHSEIAELLGLSRPTVTKHIARASAEIEQFLDH
ncbi:MAG: sigma-70 family RNA polymerase sigma factor [Pseudomonadota bacterium]